MPTKKTPAKKTANISAKFSAKVPEEMMNEYYTPKKYEYKYKNYKKGSNGALYFMGFIGAAIYFVGKAVGFRMGVLGILKALVRPVFLVHGLLKYLGL
ncbi:MAG: hypothetical protein NT085_01775 [candidate division SR1 bacterium]|nr:hypothetical protein [candidate division SR1 bacterium]